MKEEIKEKTIGEGVGFDRIRRITGYFMSRILIISTPKQKAYPLNCNGRAQTLV